MAKDQNLSLNPTKISGICGRLMCCLKYETGNYESGREKLPDLGDQVMTPFGAGKVVGLNILERKVQVDIFEINKIEELPLDDVVEADSEY